jgi:hypothetical protein
LVIAYYGGLLVPPFGMAYPETRRVRLNEPVLLGPGQNRETKEGKTLVARVIYPHSNFTGYIFLTHKIESSYIPTAISDQIKTEA